jgi:hypothetical protein
VFVAPQGIGSYHLIGAAPFGHLSQALRSSDNQKVQRGLDEPSRRVSSNYYGYLLKWGHITCPLLCQPLALFHTILHSTSTIHQPIPFLILLRLSFQLHFWDTMHPRQSNLRVVPCSTQKLERFTRPHGHCGYLPRCTCRGYHLFLGSFLFFIHSLLLMLLLSRRGANRRA